MATTSKCKSFSIKLEFIRDVPPFKVQFCSAVNLLKISFPCITGLVSKPTDWLATKIHDMDYLVTKSNYEKIFGPGDEFHPNPYATAVLGLHYLYTAGKSICYNQDGITSIRCGATDIVDFSTTTVVFKGDNTTNSNSEIVKGAMKNFQTSLQKKTMIRVLLKARTPHNPKDVQVYYNNMFVHHWSFSTTANCWCFTLRSYPREGDISNTSKCDCCELNNKR